MLLGSVSENVFKKKEFLLTYFLINLKIKKRLERSLF
jgi:hypothetical protein